MHIAEGVLSGGVLAAGWLAAGAGTGYGLWRMDYDRLPRVAALASAFFVASFIPVPVPGASVHLILSGLTGLILGWAAFPALFVALLLQAVFFQVGGLSTLGVNTMVMGVPAVACYYCFHGAAIGPRAGLAGAASFAAGALAIVLGWALWAACIATAGREFLLAIPLSLLGHLPVMATEGALTYTIVRFLRRVKPELLTAPVGGARNVMERRELRAEN